MNHSGDAAEQIVRLGLEGMEVAIKITGNGAKEIAAAIFAAVKNRDKNKIKGKQRLTSMLKSGKELTIFSVKNGDLKKFVEDAKRYGVVYCVVRNPKDNPDGVCDIMVRSEDAPKINRIVENIKLATVDTEVIKKDIQKGKEGEKSEPEKDIPEKADDDRLLDDLLGKPVQKEEPAPENPSAAKMEKSPLSEPISEKPSKSAEGTTKTAERPSVREELKSIKAAQKEKADDLKREEPTTPNRPKAQKPAEHKQPSRKKQRKKVKER